MEFLYQTRTTPLSESATKRQCGLWKKPDIGVCDGLTVCHRCSSKKVTHVDKQLRSGDEGMSVEAHCTSCGHRWIL